MSAPAPSTASVPFAELNPGTHPDLEGAYYMIGAMCGLGVRIRENKYAILSGNAKSPLATTVFVRGDVIVPLCDADADVIPIPDSTLSLIVVKPDSASGRVMDRLDAEEDRFFPDATFFATNGTEPTLKEGEDAAKLDTQAAAWTVPTMVTALYSGSVFPNVHLDHVRLGSGETIVLDGNGEWIGVCVDRKLTLLTEEFRRKLAQVLLALPADRACSPRCQELMRSQLGL